MKREQYDPLDQEEESQSDEEDEESEDSKSTIENDFGRDMACELESKSMCTDLADEIASARSGGGDQCTPMKKTKESRSPPPLLEYITVYPIACVGKAVPGLWVVDRE